MPSYKYGRLPNSEKLFSYFTRSAKLIFQLLSILVKAKCVEPIFSASWLPYQLLQLSCRRVTSTSSTPVPSLAANAWPPVDVLEARAFHAV